MFIKVQTSMYINNCTLPPCFSVVLVRTCTCIYDFRSFVRSFIRPSIHLPRLTPINEAAAYIATKSIRSIDSTYGGQNLVEPLSNRIDNRLRTFKTTCASLQPEAGNNFCHSLSNEYVTLYINYI